MATKPVVAISFKDIAVNESVRETLDLACARLAEEFPEITRFELTLSPDGRKRDGDRSRAIPCCGASSLPGKSAGPGKLQRILGGRSARR